MLARSHYLILAMIPALPALAQETEATRIVPPRYDVWQMGNSRFGQSVAIDGDWLVVGAPHLNSPDPASEGGVFFYRRCPTGWELMDAFRGYDSLDVTDLGWSVDVQGSTAVVGARYSNHAHGLVEVYQHREGAWQRVQVIHQWPPSVKTSWFGESVALDGDVLAVGASAHGGHGPEFVHVGQVTIFERSEGTGLFEPVFEYVPETNFDSKLKALGRAVAVHGDMVVAGAPSPAGGVYVFERLAGSWVRTDLILPPQFHWHNWFGVDVYVDEDDLIIGARQDKGQGSVHVYARELVPEPRWVHVQELQASDGFAHFDFGDAFGTSVDLDGDRLLVGAIHGKTGDDAVGRVYLFERGGHGAPFVETESYRSSTAHYGEEHGTDVAIQSGILLGGASNAGGAPPVPRPGGVYVFHSGIGQGHCPPRENSTGAPARLSVLLRAGSGLILAVDRLPPGSTGLVFGSDLREPPLPFDHGLLCLAPGKLLRISTLVAGARGLAYTDTSWEDFQHWGAVIGQDWHVQATFFDEVEGAWNTTNAVTVTVQ